MQTFTDDLICTGRGNIVEYEMEGSKIQCSKPVGPPPGYYDEYTPLPQSCSSSYYSAIVQNDPIRYSRGYAPVPPLMQQNTVRSLITVAIHISLFIVEACIQSYCKHVLLSVFHSVHDYASNY